MKKNETFKRQTKVYKTHHRKLNTEQNEPHKNPDLISGAPEG